MPQEEKPIFTVSLSGETAVLRINGRASYLTSAPVNSLFSHLMDQGKQKILVDFENCAGMDSTFLGILAGGALRIKKEFPDGFMGLCNLGPRNMELVRNLGLHRILTVVDSPDGGPSIPETAATFEALESETVETDSVLKAHKNLIEADRENAAKFQDVIKFLEKETNG